MAVIAIGGNALIKDTNHRSFEDQYEAAREACRHIAMIVKAGWCVVVVHGNGPQVGFMLRRSELTAPALPEIPLDVCDADTQGSIGYTIQQNLRNLFVELDIARDPVTVVTQVEVDPEDPAFSHPSKPIGSFMSEETARRLQGEGWRVMEDAGRGWRRVVPSPTPVRIVEESVIRQLIMAGMVVIAIGGGGIPVVADEAGYLQGVSAVIDKDYAASLLARRLGAELFIICTGVEKVALDYGTPNETPLDQLTVTEAKHLLDEGRHFPEGSMAPKMRAVVEYLEGGGHRAIITSPKLIARALAGETGTHLTN